MAARVVSSPEPVKERSFGIWLLAAAALVVVVVAWRQCTPPAGSDEERIAAAIEAMRLAVEAKSAKTLVEHVHPEYRDQQNLDRASLRQMLMGRFFQSKASLKCLAVPGAIEIDPQTGEATVTIWAAAFEGIVLSELTAPNGDAFEIQARFRKDAEGDWKVVWHERTPFDATEVWNMVSGTE